MVMSSSNGLAGQFSMMTPLHFLLPKPAGAGWLPKQTDIAKAPT